MLQSSRAFSRTSMLPSSGLMTLTWWGQTSISLSVFPANHVVLAFQDDAFTFTYLFIFVMIFICPLLIHSVLSSVSLFFFNDHWLLEIAKLGHSTTKYFFSLLFLLPLQVISWPNCMWVSVEARRRTLNGGEKSGNEICPGEWITSRQFTVVESALPPL